MTTNNLNAFSTAADYLKQATNFFITGFEFGANAYETVRNQIDSLKRDEAETALHNAPQPKSSNIFQSVIQDRDKTIAVLAITILAAGLIIAAKR